MTAERRARATTAAPIRFDAGLQERNFGDIRGQSYDALGVDISRARLRAARRRALGRVPQPRRRRVAARHRGAAHATDGNLAVVTHGLVCHSLAQRQLQHALPR